MSYGGYIKRLHMQLKARQSMNNESAPSGQGASSNPHGYEKNWTIENHRDELIERLGIAIKRINSLEWQIREVLNISLDNDYSDSEAMAAITRITKEAKPFPAPSAPSYRGDGADRLRQHWASYDAALSDEGKIR